MLQRREFDGKNILVRHTIKNDGPHNNTNYDHFNDTATIMLMLHGNGMYFMEGNQYPLTDGDIVVMGMDAIHSFHFEEKGYHERLSIYFSSSVLSPFWEHELPLMQMFSGQDTSRGSHYSREDYDQEEIGRVVAELCRMTDTLTAPYTPMDEARVHLLILRLLFSLYDSFEKKRFSNPSASNRNTIVMAICRYIKENLTEELTYSSIQNKFFVSRYFLSVQFRQNTGLTLTEYILHTRLLKVNALVRQGIGITKASEMAGFRNYSQFYKEFKKHKNVSPREYYR